MSNFTEVPRPVVWPNACACCTGIDGPMIDTRRELPGLGRLYLCQRCVKSAAQVLGFAKGKRMDELADAAKQLHVAQQEVDKHVAAEAELEEKLLARDQRIDTLESENTRQAQRIEQLVAALKDEAAVLTSVVGE